MSDLPLAVATLKAMLAEKSSSATSSGPSSASSPAAFRVGPMVLRAPTAVRRAPVKDERDGDEASEDGTPPTSDLLGELLDMVLVGADNADSGAPEVHLQFKAEVFGGLHLKLVKRPAGLEAFFGVADAAARRAVAGHVDDLVKHLRQRGFAVVSWSLDVG